MYYLEEPIKLWPIVAQLAIGGESNPSATSGDSDSSSDAGAAAAPAEKKDEEKTFIQIKLVDEYGKPVPNVKYQVRTPDGKVVKGSLDGSGAARLDGLVPGICHVSFPDQHVLGEQ